jgi:hypothetical protein
LREGWRSLKDGAQKDKVPTWKNVTTIWFVFIHLGFLLWRDVIFKKNDIPG